jgi:Trk K+ transport system NAD-binding subunit
VLILGAAKASRIIGKYLQSNGRHVVIIDSNKENIGRSIKEGLQAMQVNVYSENLADNITFNDMGYLMAMTSSDEVNQFATTKLHEYFGEEGTYRLIASEEINNQTYDEEHILFSPSHDFIKISEVARKYAQINELPLTTQEALDSCLNSLENEEMSVPLFIKRKNGSIEILNAYQKSLKFEEGMALVYMGKKIEFASAKTEEE